MREITVAVSVWSPRAIPERPRLPTRRRFRLSHTRLRPVSTWRTCSLTREGWSRLCLCCEKHLRRIPITQTRTGNWVMRTGSRVPCKNLGRSVSERANSTQASNSIVLRPIVIYTSVNMTVSPEPSQERRLSFYRFLSRFREHYKGNWKQAARNFDRAFEFDLSLLHAQIGKALSHGIRHQTEQGPSRSCMLRKTESMNGRR